MIENEQFQEAYEFITEEKARFLYTQYIGVIRENLEDDEENKKSMRITSTILQQE